ncbi:MAG: holo-ACP synthase [Candidatus Ancaeobacter aquaticus]|nr:holo-ACP synthase [Candidatus Ancaeobacter aquaticus]
MIVGIGIDIIENERIQNVIERHGEQFYKRIFTEHEIEYCKNQKKNALLHFAGRFTAKEAALKALGTGLTDGICWTDIEIENHLSGKPVLSFSGKAKEVYDKLGGHTVFVSISHSKGYSTSQVIIEK